MAAVPGKNVGIVEVSASAARREWARPIQQVVERDPLGRPRCGVARRIIGFIEQPAAFENNLRHLSVCAKGRQGAVAG